MNIASQYVLSVRICWHQLFKLNRPSCESILPYSFLTVFNFVFESIITSQTVGYSLPMEIHNYVKNHILFICQLQLLYNSLNKTIAIARNLWDDDANNYTNDNMMILIKSASWLLQMMPFMTPLMILKYNTVFDDRCHTMDYYRNKYKCLLHCVLPIFSKEFGTALICEFVWWAMSNACSSYWL